MKYLPGGYRLLTIFFRLTADYDCGLGIADCGLIKFKSEIVIPNSEITRIVFLQKGGVPAAPSGTATLLRLSPSH